MAKPLVMSFSHELGTMEAMRRITEGIDYLKTRHPHLITVLDSTWTGHHLDYAVSALKQTIRGYIDVEDERVTISVTLPLLLAMMADKAKAILEKEGTLLLEKK